MGKRMMVIDVPGKRRKGRPGCLEVISQKHRLHIEGEKTSTKKKIIVQ